MPRHYPLFFATTMSFADDYARLEDFLKADPEYARIDDECNRLRKLRQETDEAADTATRNYHKWMCCRTALEDKVAGLTDEGDLGFVFSVDLVLDYLGEGEEMFERMMRAELVKAGEASQAWLQADEDLESATASYSKVRIALVQVWRDKQASDKEAAQ